MSLEELLVSGEEMDEELLKTVLLPYVRIEKETLHLRPTAQFSGLTAKGKVVAFLLSRKGLLALKLVDSERVAPQEVIRETGVPSGSAHPALKALYESRPQIVDRDGGSNYWVPSWAIQDAVALLTGGAK